MFVLRSQQDGMRHVNVHSALDRGIPQHGSMLEGQPHRGDPDGDVSCVGQADGQAAAAFRC